MLVALGAVAHVASAAGRRAVPVGGLLAGPMRTGLARGELLTALELPVQTGTHGYVKLKRGASSWPIATAAAVAVDGVLTRLVLGGVAGTPVELERRDVRRARQQVRLEADAAGHAPAVVDELLAERRARAR